MKINNMEVQNKLSHYLLIGYIKCIWLVSGPLMVAVVEVKSELLIYQLFPDSLLIRSEIVTRDLS
jgi:hypothetical protein